MKDAEIIKYALDRIGGRWKSMIIWELKHGPKRFSDLKTEISGITQKMLTSSLVEMQKDGLLVRKSFPQIPPRVEYTLTNLGESMVPISAAFYEWGALNRGMNHSKDYWKKEELAEEIISHDAHPEERLDYANDEVTNLVDDPTINSEMAQEKENISEEKVENDPWFFAPMPQKKLAKKKSSKKSSFNDPGTQQLGLF